jgi:hypothetical protein
VAGDRQRDQVVEVEVGTGQPGEVAGGQRLELLAGLVGAAGLAQQHGEGGPPAEVGGEPVHEPPQGRLQLGQPALLPPEPDQDDHVVDGDHRVVGPPAQGQGLPGQPLGLVEVAAQHRLAGPEQRGCQEKWSCPSSRAARS